MVSICIGLYNAAEFISETLDSIKAQTYQDFECVMVDDHSTDDTVAIVSRYCKEDPRFKLIVNMTDVAYKDSHNLSYRLAKGKYLFRCDNEDVMEPTWLEEMVSFMYDNPGVDVGWCEINRFVKEDDGWKVYPFTRKENDSEYLDELETKPCVYFHHASIDQYWITWHNQSSVIRKSFLDQHPYLEYFVSTMGDYIFWHGVAAYDGRFRKYDRTLITTRTKPTSLCRTGELYKKLTNLAQYYIAYFKQICFFKYAAQERDESKRNEYNSCGRLFMNTAEYFRDELKKENKWEEVPERFRI